MPRHDNIRVGDGFPDRLYDLRIERYEQDKSFTQAHVAAKIGVTRGWYSKMENGVIDTIRPDVAQKLVALYGLGTHWRAFVKEAGEPVLIARKNGNYNTLNAEGGVMDVGVRFPSRIVEARRNKGWDQKTLAEKAGMHIVTVNRHEKGRVLPTEDSFYTYVDTLGVEDGWLYGTLHEPKLRLKLMKAHEEVEAE